MDSKPERFEPGDRVVYRSYNVREFGVVTSRNDSYVFVRFDRELHSKACRAEDLVKAHGKMVYIYGNEKTIDREP